MTTPLATRLTECPVCKKPAAMAKCSRCKRFAFCSTACEKANPELHTDNCYAMLDIFQSVVMPVVGEMMKLAAPTEAVKVERQQGNHDTIHARLWVDDQRLFTTAMELVNTWDKGQRELKRYLFFGKIGALTAAVIYSLKHSTLPQFLIRDEPQPLLAYDDRYEPLFAIVSRPIDQVGGGQLTLSLSEHRASAPQKKKKKPFNSPRPGSDDSPKATTCTVDSTCIPVILLVPRHVTPGKDLECVTIDLAPFMFCPTATHLQWGTLAQLGVVATSPVEKVLAEWRENKDAATLEYYDIFRKMLDRQECF